MKRSYQLLPIIRTLFFVALFSWSEVAMAQDENAFTSDLARSFSTTMPEVTVSIKGPLTLSLSIPRTSGVPDDLQVNLDRVWAYCRRNSQDCQRGVTEFVTRTAQAVRQQEMPIEKEKILLVIRSERNVQNMAAGLPVQPVAERIAGDLWLVCVIDGEPAAPGAHGKTSRKVGIIATRGDLVGQIQSGKTPATHRQRHSPCTRRGVWLHRR